MIDYTELSKKELIHNLKNRIVLNGLNSIVGTFKIYKDVLGLFKLEELVLTRKGYSIKNKKRTCKYENFLKRTIVEIHIWMDKNKLLQF